MRHGVTELSRQFAEEAVGCGREKAGLISDPEQVTSKASADPLGNRAQ